MAKNSSIAKSFRAFNTSIKTGSRNALNKAIKSTHKLVRQDLKADTGLETKRVNARVNLVTAKPKKTIALVIINIGKNLLGDFAPKVKKVRTTVANAVSKYGVAKKKYKGTFYGVTVKIAGSREFVPGAFIRTANIGKRYKDLVLQRVGKNKYPTKAPKSDVVKRSVERRKAQHTNHMKAQYEAAYDNEIQAQLKTKINKLTDN